MVCLPLIASRETNKTLPRLLMYSACHVNYFLFAKVGIRSGITYGDKTRKFIALRRIDSLLDIFSFLFYWDVQRASKTFSGSGQEDIFEGCPHGCEII